MNPNFIKKSQFYFIFSFFGLIVLGILLLKAPFVVHKNGLSWIDAAFTATSAVCVTGLNTVATSGFNLPGQLIILVLIQSGGIGIMTLTAVILVLVRSMSMGGKMMISNVSDDFPIRSLEKLLLLIVGYTFFIEAAGAVLLFYGFYVLMSLAPGHAAYMAVFHSVSAFCNAGFTIFDDSLINCPSFIKIIISFLIIFGGLGVYVIYDLLHIRRNRTVFRIHTKLVLLTSFFLIIGGTVAIRLLEVVETGTPISWVDSYFQSVTARTAGFNSVDMTTLHSSSILVIMALMMIGASPGSTGGGIKTTTAALVFISVYNTLKGNRVVLLFKRRIPEANILKAFTITLMYILLSILGVILISLTENESLESTFFEVISALGTVGLSLGLCAKAGVFCKLVLIAFMFFGRVGPFTFFLFLLSREKSTKLEYPEERLILG